MTPEKNHLQFSAEGIPEIKMRLRGVVELLDIRDEGPQLLEGV